MRAFTPILVDSLRVAVVVWKVSGMDEELGERESEKEREREPEINEGDLKKKKKSISERF